MPFKHWSDGATLTLLGGLVRFHQPYTPEDMNEVERPSQVSLIAFMAVFVVLAVPLVAILWETLNQLLALKTDIDHLIALPAALLFAGLLYALKRALQRDRAGRGGNATTSSREYSEQP